MADFNIRDYAANSESIGNVLFWTLPDSRVASSLFSGKLDELGISKKRFREETPKANFMEALRETCRRTASKIEKMKEDAESLMFGVYSIGRQDDDLNLNVKCRVVFFKKTSTIQCYGDQSIGDCVRGLFDDYATSISSGLVRSFVISTIRDCDASLLRPTGGIYFVPVYNAVISDKLAKLLSSTGSGILYTMKVPNCDNEKGVAMELAKDDMLGRLNEVISFVSSAKRENTVSDYLSDVSDVRELAKRYSELLNGERQLQDVIGKCQDVEQMISNKIAELRLAKELENDKTEKSEA